MARVLIVSTNYDLPTNYLSWWLQSLGAQLQAKGHEVSYLRDYEVDESSLASAIASWSPEFVMIGGHGNVDRITQMNTELLLVACINDQILAGTKSFFASCLTGIRLVPSTVSKGAIGAAGFTAEFVWLVAGENPEGDYLAEPFKRLMVEPSLKFVETGRFADWYSEIHRVGNEEVSKWGWSDDPQASQVVLAIRQDMNSATYVSSFEEEPSLGAESLVPLLIVGGLALAMSR